MKQAMGGPGQACHGQATEQNGLSEMGGVGRTVSGTEEASESRVALCSWEAYVTSMTNPYEYDQLHSAVVPFNEPFDEPVTGHSMRLGFQVTMEPCVIARKEPPPSPPLPGHLQPIRR